MLGYAQLHLSRLVAHSTTNPPWALLWHAAAGYLQLWPAGSVNLVKTPQFQFIMMPYTPMASLCWSVCFGLHQISLNAEMDPQLVLQQNSTTVRMSALYWYKHGVKPAV
jgi:hypothetical protein